MTLIHEILKSKKCVYCQEEFKTPEKMHAHVLKDHPGTYAAETITAEKANNGSD